MALDRAPNLLTGTEQRPPSKKKPRGPGRRKASVLVLPEEPSIIPGVPDIPFDLERYVKSRDEEMTPKAITLVERYRRDPFLFVENELGISCENWKNDRPPANWPGNYWPIWSKQREILNALVKHRRVAVTSGHGLGKSFIAAIATLYLGYVWHGLGVTTAPTFRQVERVLWGEIHYMYNQAGGQAKLGGNLKKTSLELGDKWFIEGISVRDPQAAITGFHEENVFAVIDEAGGVSQDVFDALEGVLTSANSFVLLIGNPIDANGPFAAAFKPGSPYHQVHLSCWDCPNVVHGVNYYPKLVSAGWPQEKKARWGEDSNLYRVRVCGQFPIEGKNSLLPMKAIELAQTEIPDKKGKIVSFGLDIARQGTDNTVIGVRYSSGLFEVLAVKEKLRETETSGLMVRIYNDLVPPHSDNKPPVNVDDVGLGGGVTDMLINEGIAVNAINGSESADSAYFEEAEDDEELDPEKFMNLRAITYWRLRRHMQDQKCFFQDDDLAHELSKIPLSYTPKGQIKIPPKDEIRRELKGASPDRADCMMLAWAADEGDSEREMIRFL